MLNTATSYLSLLQEDDIELKLAALDKLDLLVDEHWSEISDKIPDLESFYNNPEFSSKQKLLSLILSKLYYNLEEYDKAIKWALKSEEKFDISERSLYVSTILKKILDKYIKAKKNNFFPKNEKIEIEDRISSIVERCFNDCINRDRFRQAIGFSIESYDLDRLTISIESSKNIRDSLNFVYEIAQDSIENKEYKSAVLDQILKLFIKHAGNEYMSITNCQFLLNNTEALSSTLINILSNEKDPLIAFQIAFDLYDNQNPSYLRKIISEINKINESKHIPEEQLSPLLNILSGEIPRNIIFEILQKRNQTDPNIITNLTKAVEKGGSVVHLGVILTHSLLNSHTGNDKFLKDNITWVSKATNWARFCATSSLGVTHMGNVKKGQDIMRPYLPGNSQTTSIYAYGGAYYGIGLIYANTNDANIKNMLLSALELRGNEKEPIQHGIYLALGLVCMGTHDREIYDTIKAGIFNDNAVIGEAAGYAAGLVMAGSMDSEAITELKNHAHESQHEKIIRAIAISLALIVYGGREAADTLIFNLIEEKDPILRYGAMYCIGMAYAGSGNTEMLKKLIKVSVSDVDDNVRRSAMINIGFLQIRDPDILFEKLKVISLLSESYNSHVRYGAAMAIGISCAGTAKVNPYKTIQPLFQDPNYLVRQVALISSGIIFSQTTSKQEPGIQTFLDNLEEVINNKDEHVLIRFGGLLSKGLMELGGRNCNISLVSSTGENKMTSIIGMCLFTQYYYWFPMIHFINLAVNPTMLIGLDNTMHPPKNYKVLSKSKPSIFGYPVEDKEKEKTKKVKTEVAVLSTHSRVKAKDRKTTSTMNAIKESSSKMSQSSVELKPAPSGKIPTEEEKKEEEKKEEEKKEEEKKEEPNEEILNNPIRILPKQKNVIEEILDQDYLPIVKGRLNGFVMLKKKKDDAVADYGEFKEVQVMEKHEEKKEDKKEEKKDNYTPVPTTEQDYEIPEDIDMGNIK